MLRVPPGNENALKQRGRTNISAAMVFTNKWDQKFPTDETLNEFLQSDDAKIIVTAIAAENETLVPKFIRLYQKLEQKRNKRRKSTVQEN